MIRLSRRHIETVRCILREHVPDYTVWAFGSRVTGERLKPFSDLDLVVLTERPLDARCCARLRESFAESNLPIKVDVVDWSSIDPGLRRKIEVHHERLLPPQD